MKKLTFEQQEWVCNVIGRWYFKWKKQLVNYEEIGLSEKMDKVNLYYKLKLEKMDSFK